MRTRTLVVACLSLGLLSARALSAPPIEVGKPFPDIVLPALDPLKPGDTFAVSMLRGRKVVLHVFASW